MLVRRINKIRYFQPDVRVLHRFFTETRLNILANIYPDSGIKSDFILYVMKKRGLCVYMLLIFGLYIPSVFLCDLGAADEPLSVCFAVIIS